MSGPFVYEIASVYSAMERTHGKDPYAAPWYLVIGDPGSGRSTAVQRMDLTWEIQGPLPIGFNQAQCTYWLAREALFIEPGPSVLGPQRNPQAITALCQDLKLARPREAMDGILLVLNIADLIDLDDQRLDEYGSRIRGYLVEVGKALQEDVPVYVVLTRYDTLWGFAEVFQWGPDRVREEPWGFVLPFDLDSQDAVPRIREELEALNARFEAFCMHRLLSEDPPEQRTRAFQHLAEVRSLKERLSQLFEVLFRANSYERAPWARAVIIGSAVPGTGDRLRASVTRFINMGLAQPPAAPTAGRPGGLPIHAFMKLVVLPEKDLVRTRTRWRDDPIFVISLVVGVLLLVATGLTELILALLEKPH
ncbi:type VI secretion system protein [Chondromyces apiculatus]|uniref:Putative membrane protein, SciS/IcmF-like protein n=1 Tax=Chondromyces apiculatus DSM 436 TaxID=1192034 RepID=A0A017T602_9BACT|nr:type VI secretion system protein [Chondromyces apiculatus]EYF04688.1 Putative membrane protein, SciS/IcmF-like protein [Chondromyces apiculatus DSM 436]